MKLLLVAACLLLASVTQAQTQGQSQGKTEQENPMAPHYHIMGLNRSGAFSAEANQPIILTVYVGATTDHQPLSPRPPIQDKSRRLVEQLSPPIFITAFCSKALNCTKSIDADIVYYFVTEHNSTGADFSFTPTTFSSNPEENYIGVSFGVEGQPTPDLARIRVTSPTLTKP